MFLIRTRIVRGWSEWILFHSRDHMKAFSLLFLAQNCEDYVLAAYALPSIPFSSICNSRCSHYSINDNEPWISNLTKWIQQFYGEQTCKKDARKCKNKLLLGICFGCQAIATALGGSVSTVNPQLGFIFGVESVVPNERYRKKLYLLVWILVCIFPMFKALTDDFQGFIPAF